MPKRMPHLDHVFRALADPTRRGVVESLSDGPRSTLELARGSRMALPSFLQHLDVLATAGLVRSRKVGRVRNWALVPQATDTARHWLDDQRDTWNAKLDRLDAHLNALKERPE